VLSCGELYVRQSLLQLDVTIEIIGVKNLFPPIDLDTGFLACLSFESAVAPTVW